MSLLESLMRRLGYAKLDQFGLELANDYVVSHNRKAVAVEGDWVVGWRDSAALVAVADIPFEAAPSVPKLALNGSRAQTQPQYFGTPGVHNMASTRLETERDGVVQAEAVIVMQSEVLASDLPSEPSDEQPAAGDTLMLAPTTAQRDAATPQAAVTTVIAAVAAEAADPAADDADEEEWEWIMARAKADAQAQAEADAQAQIAATERANAAAAQAKAAADAAAAKAIAESEAEAEAREWDMVMANARQAEAAVAAAPTTQPDIEIPIVVVTPQYALAAVQMSQDAAPAEVASIPAARAAAGTIPMPMPAPMAAPIVPPVAVMPPIAAPLPRASTVTSTHSRVILPPSQMGAPPHLSNGSVAPPIGLQSHTARIYVGAIPTMPGSDATRRTRPTTKIAIRPCAEPDNDPVIAPPRPNTISPAARLARPLPPLPMRTLPRPAANAQAPLRPVPRVTRVMATSGRPTTQLSVASAGAPANSSGRRLATAS